MIVLRTEKKDHSEFIFNCLFSDDLIGYLNSLSTGVKVPRVSPDEILSTKFPLPPTEEISKINEFIKHNNLKIYNQISIEEKRKKLLKEYKQSLISEVVTGKKRIID
jgi:type I restriction enzyme S subunit